MNIDEIISKYDLRLSDINGDKICVTKKFMDKFGNDKELIEQIRTTLLDKRQRTIDRINEKKTKIQQIEGLAEIKEAQNNLANWHEKFEDSFNDVGGLGVGTKPRYNFDEAYVKYPRAAAYLKAEKYANSTNYELSEIGSRALEKIIFEPDYESAIEAMEKELKEFNVGHMWD